MADLRWLYSTSLGENLFILLLIRRMFFLLLRSPPLSCALFFPFIYTLTRTWQVTPEGIKGDGVGGTGQRTGLITDTSKMYLFLLPVSATLRRVWKCQSLQVYKLRCIIQFSSHQPKSHSAPFLLKWMRIQISDYQAACSPKMCKGLSALYSAPSLQVEDQVELVVTRLLPTQSLLGLRFVGWPDDPFKLRGSTSPFMQRAPGNWRVWNSRRSTCAANTVCSLITSPRGSLCGSALSLRKWTFILPHSFSLSFLEALHCLTTCLPL